jgi:hypothetical protein
MLLVNEKNLTPRITNSNTESTTFSRKTKNITIDGKTISHTPNKDSFKTNYTFKISESLDKYVNNFIKGINK